MSNTAITATTWTDLTSNQTFTVDDPNSVVEIAVSGNCFIGANATNTQRESSSRIVIDSAGTSVNKMIGGAICPPVSGQTSYANCLSGANLIEVTGLSAGSHTVKVQVYADGASVGYCRASSLPDVEFLTVRVLERKQTAALVSNTIVKLAEVIVGAGGQANIQFSNIPGTYRHLRVEGQLRGSAVTTDVTIRAQFNGDTGSNYDSQRIQATASSPGASESLAAVQMELGDMPGSSSTSGRAAPLVWNICNYTNTIFDKAGIGEIFFITTTSSAANYIQLFGTNWRSTAAITSILLFPASGNFVQNSVCSLYGII